MTQTAFFSDLMSENVYRFLDERKIEYVIHDHLPVFTVEEAKATREKISGAHLKNLFTKDSKRGNYYLITAPADQNISLSEVRKKISAKKLSMASPEELVEYCGVKPGSVSFFNLINSKERVIYIIFRKVLQSKIVTFHPNDNSKTLEISTKDFIKLIDELSPQHIVID